MLQELQNMSIALLLFFTNLLVALVAWVLNERSSVRRFNEKIRYELWQKKMDELEEVEQYFDVMEASVLFFDLSGDSFGLSDAEVVRRNITDLKDIYRYRAKMTKYLSIRNAIEFVLKALGDVQDASSKIRKIAAEYSTGNNRSNISEKLARENHESIEKFTKSLHELRNEIKKEKFVIPNPLDIESLSWHRKIVLKIGEAKISSLTTPLLLVLLIVIVITFRLEPINVSYLISIVILVDGTIKVATQPRRGY